MSALGEARGHLDKNHWYTLRVLGAASFFDGYDASIIALALPAIIREYGLSKQGAAYMLAFVFLGSLPAIWMSRKADTVGRKKVLFWSIIGYTVFSGVTGLAPTFVAFAAFQFFARMFIAAESAVAHAMIAEEIPAPARGFGFGFLAFLTALGTGTAAILNGVVFVQFGISWRWLYAVGVPPLLVIMYFRKRLPESRRFEVARDSGALAATWRDIVKPPHLRWLVLVCAVAFSATMIRYPIEFAIEFLENDRGLSQTQANLLIVAAGLPAILLMIWAAALSDRVGRRIVGCVTASMGVLGGLGFFLLDVNYWLMIPLFAFMTAGFVIAAPTIGAYNAELFPTALRGQSAAWSTGFRSLGDSSSLLLGGLIYVLVGEKLSTTAAILMLGPIVMILLVWFYFPDTHGKELEETSGESGARDAPAPASAVPGGFVPPIAGAEPAH